MRLILTLFLFIPILLLAQPKLEFGVVTGASNHFSDLQGAETFPNGTKPAFGLNMRYFVFPSLALKLGYATTTLSGDETRMGVDWRDKRAFKYENQLHELSAKLEYEFRTSRRFVDGRFTPIFTPYCFIGGALDILNFNVDYNIKAERNPFIKIDRINSDIKNRKNIALGMPFGGGLRLDLSRSVSINLEGNLVPTLSDYLDGVSVSGNPNRRDAYGMVLMGLNYRLLPPDADNDGMVDKLDACPKQSGKRSLQGCPDIDQDGIADKEDHCPTQAGPEFLEGCPDQDTDGIADKDDLCPDIAGERSLKGCPDKDHDGVTDAIDACPDVAGKINGCPDTDNDGIADKDDACPKAAGKVIFGGCPDTDDDGIMDEKDPCPMVAGLAIDGGCPPKDSDNDGIIDRMDKCPTKAGIKEEGGCPLADADNDGVADKVDKCPTVFGIGRFAGCPDTDADGVEDSQDFCPKLYGTGKKGCPSKEEIAALRTKMSTPMVTGLSQKSYAELTELVKISAKRIKFNTGSDVLSKSSYTDLNKVTAILKTNPSYRLIVLGHTDNVGNASKNQTLSEKRAKRCADYIQNKGIAKSRLESNGYGASMPIKPNETAAGRNENRRVEFDLLEN